MALPDKILAFLDDYEAVCRKHGFHLGHHWSAVLICKTKKEADIADEVRDVAQHEFDQGSDWWLAQWELADPTPTETQ